MSETRPSEDISRPGTPPPGRSHRHDTFMRTILMAASVLFLLAILSAWSLNSLPTNLTYLAFAGVLVAMGLIPLPHVVRAGALIGMLFITGTSLLVNWGVAGEASMLYLAGIALAAVFFERRVEFVLMSLAAAAIVVVGALVLSGIGVLPGWFPEGEPAHQAAVGTLIDWLVYLVDLVATAAIVTAVIRFLRSDFESVLGTVTDTVKELQASRAELAIQAESSAGELAEAHSQADRRVAQLEAVAQVARTIAAVRDLDQILPAIVRVIAQQFGLYHVGIFLVDEQREFAVLRAASSVGGQRMLERGHRLRLDPGSLVGYAAGLGAPRVALDVGSDAVFLQSPDLPETRSELALPLLMSGRAIGVLDVQSNQPSAFSKDELGALNVLANQVATAIENARLFGESRAALEDARRAARDLVGRDWSAFYRQLTRAGYRYDGTTVRPLDGAPETPEMVELARRSEPLLTSDESGSPRMHVPIKLRGELIGVLDVEASAPGRTWTREEITLAQAAAERAALALENARLVYEAQRRAAKERTIGEISGKLGSLIDIDNILQTAAQELGRTMPGAEVVIQFQGERE